MPRGSVVHIEGQSCPNHALLLYESATMHLPSGPRDDVLVGDCPHIFVRESADTEDRRGPIAVGKEGTMFDALVGGAVVTTGSKKPR
jgi:hypothetical protein